MFLRQLVVIALLSTVSFASVIEDVRSQIAQNDFIHAKAALDNYQTQHGVTPEYLERLQRERSDEARQRRRDGSGRGLKSVR